MTAAFVQVVDDIRTVLSAETDPTPDALAALDQQFVDSVREINERLRECDRLFHDV